MGTGNRKNKEFRDPVHGYISVPAEWCAAFIDTAIFQRLRHIEQTTMRPLYPSARHDRFAHSLGVYHLAKLAFEHLKENTDSEVLAGVALGDYEAPFLVAALMHDCGHACFSHTFEDLYGKEAEEYLFSLVDQPFIDDYGGRDLPPAWHEVFSAAVFLEHYGESLKEVAQGADPGLIARMITGCVHRKFPGRRQQVENALIQLINGLTIDMDKLDYILRDTWASGVDNVSIDVRRLLSGLELVMSPAGWLDVAFRKSALSVLQSVIDGRNYLFRWIYSHHTVCYYNAVLRRAVEILDQILSRGLPAEAFLDAISSKRAFREPVQVGSCRLFLPCDDDIYSLLKAHQDEHPELKKLVQELLSRRPSRIPLWKTQAEFEILFEKRKLKERSAIRETHKDWLKPILGESAVDDVLVVDAKPKVIDLSNFDESRLWVKFRLLGQDRIVSFQDIPGHETKAGKRTPSTFYVYIPRAADEGAITPCTNALVAAPVRI
jgi:hypothetical protein